MGSTAVKVLRLARDSCAIALSEPNLTPSEQAQIRDASFSIARLCAEINSRQREETA